jgi:hypothetical protein
LASLDQVYDENIIASQFLATGGHGGHKSLIFVPFGNDVKEMFKFKKINTNETKRFISRKLFFGRRNPLEGIFNLLNADILQYFEEDYKDDEKEKIQEKMRIATRAYAARLQ